MNINQFNPMQMIICERQEEIIMAKKKKVMFCRGLAMVLATLIWMGIVIASIWLAIELADLIVIYLWNFTVHKLTSLPALNHYQGIAIALLCDILIGRSSSEGIEKELNKLKKSFRELLDDFYKAVDVSFGIY